MDSSNMRNKGILRRKKNYKEIIVSNQKEAAENFGTHNEEWRLAEFDTHKLYQKKEFQEKKHQMSH